MKRLVIAVLCCVFLLGCDHNTSIEDAVALRQKIIKSSQCQFDCTITADYSDIIFTYVLNCMFDADGVMVFSVKEPESISGISGKIGADVGALTFDDQALMFPLLADGYISPVSAPWLFMKTLRSGYIAGASETESGCRVTIYDSYEENPLQLEIWMDKNDQPVSSEIIWQGRKILSLTVSDFSCM